MSNKEGRKPLSSKPQQSSIVTDDIFGNPLAIPEDIKKELDSQGLVGRWLNAIEMGKFQGYHKRGWRLYKRVGPSSDIMGFKVGNDPDGVVRRGDCILGVKTQSEVTTHRRHLQQKAQRGYSVNADKADELRSALGNAGLKAKIHEGYDEN